MALVALIVASASATAGLAGLRTRAALAAVAGSIGSAVLLAQVPPIAALLHLRPLHVDDWLLAALGGAVAGAFSTLLPLVRHRTLRPAAR
jgi:hypothetical protein